MNIDRPFFFHTAKNFLAQALQKAGLRKFPATLPENFTRYQEQPFKVLLEHLSTPEYQGCAHIRLMMQSPDKYNVPLWISRGVVKAIYRLFWDIETHKLVDIENYFSDFFPSGVLKLVNKSEHAKFEPVIRPMVDFNAMHGDSIFIYHETAVSFFRKSVVAPFFEDHSEGDGNAKSDGHFYKELDSLGKKNLGETASVIADGLPICTVSWTN